MDFNPHKMVSLSQSFEASYIAVLSLYSEEFLLFLLDSFYN